MFKVWDTTGDLLICVCVWCFMSEVISYVSGLYILGRDGTETAHYTKVSVIGNDRKRNRKIVVA